MFSNEWKVFVDKINENRFWNYCIYIWNFRYLLSQRFRRNVRLETPGWHYFKRTIRKQNITLYWCNSNKCYETFIRLIRIGPLNALPGRTSGSVYDNNSIILLYQPVEVPRHRNFRLPRPWSCQSSSTCFAATNNGHYVHMVFFIGGGMRPVYTL